MPRISFPVILSGSRDRYRLVDVLLQWFGLTIFPLYYIYFRLLTVDDHFSLKTHSKYLIVPAFFALIYGFGVLLNPAIVPENIADVVKRVVFVRLPNCIYIMLFNISILTDQLRIIY